MKDGIGQAQNKHPLERDKMETVLLGSPRGPGGRLHPGTRGHRHTRVHAHAASLAHGDTNAAIPHSHHTITAAHDHTQTLFLSAHAIAHAATRVSSCTPT